MIVFSLKAVMTQSYSNVVDAVSLIQQNELQFYYTASITKKVSFQQVKNVLK
jgi:hypothetical protein